MSHEGIRFVSQVEAARDDAPRLGGDAIRPAKVRVDKSGGSGVEIDWADGHRSSWDFRWLRLACPCATCHEEREKDGREPGVAKAKPAMLLPMYEVPPRPTEVTPVGRYAIRFTWNDGHEAGLYSWDYLRNGCEGGNRVASTTPPLLSPQVSDSGSK
jgi:DUF971 family protein